MNITTLVLGQLLTNCYLVWDEETKEAIAIDPADEADYIIRKILDEKLVVKFIVATHGHFDHVLGLLELKLAFNAPFLMNSKDNFLLKRTSQTTKRFTGLSADPTPFPDNNLQQGNKIIFGKQTLKVIETPGHTPGGISLSTPGILFSGDMIFADGFGRTDLSYSSPIDFQKSLTKLFKLPDSTIIYPGHGLTTSVKKAKLMIE